MNSINKVLLMGYLGADPKSVIGLSGSDVATFNLATNEFIKSENGGDEKIQKTDWHKIRVWGRLATTCAKNLKKGSRVIVQGKLHTFKDDKNIKYYEIFATDVRFI